MAQRPPREQLNGMPISDTSIRQPVFITMLMLLAVTFGVLAFNRMPVNLLPEINLPIVAVTVAYPGAGPSSVVDQVTEPIEQAVNTINGIKHITSNSSEGLSLLILEFNEGTDISQAEQDVRQKINGIRNALPRDIREPIYQRFDPNQAPIMSIAIAPKTAIDPLVLRDIIEDQITPRLQRAAGVGSITVLGGQTRQINVWMQLDKLQAYGLIPAQLTRSLQSANANLGLGSINAGTQDINLRAPSMLASIDDIANIQITGTPYKISDVATVEEGVADATSYTRLDGTNAIILDVRKQSGTNTVQVADAVKVELENVFANRTDMGYIVPRDQSVSVRESVISSLEELIFATIAALIVVFLFFRDIRNTLITMAGLPIILIATFIAMSLFGLTINLITLLALSLCVGLVIDDAIVVRENIFRHTLRGKSARVASSVGTAEVSLSVIAMTLTIVAVFVPVTFTTGTVGIIFKSFGITVAVAMLLSLIEAFTFAPMLSANAFRTKNKQAKDDHNHHSAHAVAIDENDPNASLLHEANESPGKLGDFYGNLLKRSLRTRLNRVMIMVVAVVVLGLSVLVAGQLKFTFFPAEDPHEYVMGFEMPPGTTLAETDRIARQVEQVLLNEETTVSVISTVGFTGNPERAEFSVKLKGKTPTQAAQDAVRPKLSFAPNLAFAVPSFQGSSTGVTGRTLQLSLQTNRAPEEITPLVDQIIQTMRQTPGMVDVATNYVPGKPELRLLADPNRIGDLGLTNEEIASSVRALINGERATVLRRDGIDTDIVVRLAPADRSDAAALGNIIIPTRSGSVALSSLGQFELTSSAVTIRRYDRLNQVLIGANLQDLNIGDAQTKVRGIMQSLNVPNDVVWSFTGQSQQQTEGFSSLLIAMALSVLFVYMVLASQFGSFTQPLVIMLAMPFSFIGAFLGLILTNTDLDITGMIGLIMLLGLVTKNSILLVDFTNRLRQAGLEKHEALRVAGAVRLRPILMTTFAIIAGALPVAMGIHIFGTGQGGEFRRGLATVLIGGLTTSMLLTLFVVPAAYSLLDSLTSRLRRSESTDDKVVTPIAAGGLPSRAPGRNQE
ncbi:MAG: efflux RND transporter permease subunit [Chloroflexi bacterium]|nr:efflux RND transporter permease subunit [Chloroflexota bacterium]